MQDRKTPSLCVFPFQVLVARQDDVYSQGQWTLYELPPAWTLFKAISEPSSMPKVPEATSHFPSLRVERAPSTSDDTAVTPIVEHTVSSSHAAAGIVSSPLLMKRQVLIKASDGSSMKVRALLDLASSASFISERLVQGLGLPRSHHNLNISGVAGLSHQSPLQSFATFKISPVRSPPKDFAISAIVVPWVTCDLPLQPVHRESNWTHLSELPWLIQTMAFLEELNCS